MKTTIFTKIGNLTNAKKRVARRLVLGGVAALAVGGMVALFVTTPRASFDDFSFSLDHSASRGVDSFRATQSEVADALPLAVGHHVRITSFGDHVELVWEGELTPTSLPLAQAAVRAILLRTPQQERGTDITRAMLSELTTLHGGSSAKAKAHRHFEFLGTDGQEDAANLMVALPADQRPLFTEATIVFTGLRQKPRAASLATLAGASTLTFDEKQSAGKLQESLLGLQPWSRPVRLAGEAALVLAGLLGLSLVMFREKALALPTIQAWVGIESADGVMETKRVAVPSSGKVSAREENPIYVGFGGAEHISLPTDFPQGTLLEIVPLSTFAARLRVVSGDGIGLASSDGWLKKGDSAEITDGEEVMFDADRSVWFRIDEREPQPAHQTFEDPFATAGGSMGARSPF